MPFRSLTIISALVALAGLAPGAHAQCSVFRLNVPDFDQKRLHAPPASEGLPGDGAMYCGPTSAANYLAYLSNIGYAAAFDGPRNWQSQSNYDDATDFIAELGVLSSTSEDGGTGFVETSDGLNAWLEARGLDDDFVACGLSPSNGGVVGSPLGFYQGMRFGSLPMICMGRYEYLPPNWPAPGLPARWDRTSGHALTLTRVYDACDPNPTIYFRNPSTGGDDETTQSPFITHSLATEEFSAFFTTGGDTSSALWRQLWEIVVPGSSTRRMIDGMYFIVPMHGITVDATRGEVSIQNTGALDDLNLTNGVRPTNAAPGTTIERVALSSHPGIGAAVVRGRSTVLNRLDLADGTMVPLRTIASPGPLVFDAYGDLFVADGASLVRLRLTASGGAERIASVPLPAAPSALAFDDARGDVIIAWSDPGMIARIPSTLATPSAIEFFAFAPQFIGGVSIAVSDVDGSIFASSTGRPGIMHLVRGPNGNLQIATFICPSYPGPRDLHVDHRGRLIFSSGGVMHEWARTASGSWGPRLGSWLQGRPAGGQFALFTARNGAPDWAGTRADINERDPQELGTPFVECVADVDDGSFTGLPDGAVTIDDLLYYLHIFEAGAVRADVDGGSGTGTPDGGVTIDDLLYYLFRFEAGC